MGDTRKVEMQREYPHAPEKVWRALTQPHWIREWLMETDFELLKNHRFRFEGDWGAVECRILEIEPMKTLSYTWEAQGLESVVTWTLTPTEAGTLLCMKQTGFRDDQEQAYRGATFGWRNFFGRLEDVLTRME